MRRAYPAVGWGLVLLGAVHMFATTQIFSGLTPRAVWFFGSGIAMALTGALNLLNHSYAANAPGLRRVCVATNGVMTLFGAVAGATTNASAVEIVIVIGLTGGATLLSITR